MKVLFFGTPQIAIPFLEWLHKNHQVVGVVTKPDEPVGRGHKLTPPPPKIFSLANNLPCLQPEGKWTDDKGLTLRNFGADVGVAVAYGRLMPESVFLAPRLGTINIHFSLLPKYRGAAPIQWSLIKGEKISGVTAFWIVKELDAGPMCAQEEIPIDPTDNALSLKKKLTHLGIRVLGKVMKDLEQGKVVKENQMGEPTVSGMSNLVIHERTAKIKTSIQFLILSSLYNLLQTALDTSSATSR